MSLYLLRAAANARSKPPCEKAPLGWRFRQGVYLFQPRLGKPPRRANGVRLLRTVFRSDVEKRLRGLRAKQLDLMGGGSGKSAVDDRLEDLRRQRFFRNRSPLGVLLSRQGLDGSRNRLGSRARFIRRNVGFAIG